MIKEPVPVPSQDTRNPADHTNPRDLLGVAAYLFTSVSHTASDRPALGLTLGSQGPAVDNHRLLMAGSGTPRQSVVPQFS